PRGGDDLLDLHQRLALEPGVMAHALRAIGAILGTGAGLDAEQRAHLDGVGVPVLAMDRLGPEQQVVEGQREQLFDLFQSPVVADGLLLHVNSDRQLRMLKRWYRPQRYCQPQYYGKGLQLAKDWPGLAAAAALPSLRRAGCLGARAVPGLLPRSALAEDSLPSLRRTVAGRTADAAVRPLPAPPAAL